MNDEQQAEAVVDGLGAIQCLCGAGYYRDTGRLLVDYMMANFPWNPPTPYGDKTFWKCDNCGAVIWKKASD